MEGEKINTVFVKSSPRFIHLVTASILFAASSQAIAVAYTFTDLGTLVGRGGFSAAYDINNAGQVVGESTALDDTSHATLWNGAAATDLGALGPSADFSVARGINNAGQVVGYAYGHGDGIPTQAVLWNGADITELGRLPGVRYPNIASAINDSGQIAGSSGLGDDSSDFFSQATLWNGTTVTTFGVMGGLATNAHGINNSGQVVGQIVENDDSRTAIFWDGTVWHTLGNGTAYAINDSGQIVGEDSGTAILWEGTARTILGSGTAYAINDSGQIVGEDSGTAILWDGTAASDLNSLLDAGTIGAGWVLTSASGINDNGAIVGAASNSRLGIISHAFLMTPVPEPEIHAMLLAGLGVVGFMARRRKRR
ncbi:PEP-CTERM sorting domain-containing protein [Nitrosospira sp. NpAV]|uniref:PEP-CTERM sorting domain-containing protein n=1 Tax=Nitrosospira sp. NpAV TaxID=58133 RepID=UPI0005A24A86|nr:PEP-CTERM sorting domain-containing protein [Nitrosospira sp. NpAV]KIO48209.1 hypothetical protein SQ11_13725 [Nitrosospira sp. NpAV]